MYGLQGKTVKLDDITGPVNLHVTEDNTYNWNKGKSEVEKENDG